MCWLGALIRLRVIHQALEKPRAFPEGVAGLWKGFVKNPRPGAGWAPLAVARSLLAGFAVHGSWLSFGRMLTQSFMLKT